MQKIQAILERIAEGATIIDLHKEELSDADVKDIATALKVNHTLTKLDLQHNKISDAGAKDIAMALKDNHTLTELDLKFNKISSAGAKDFAMALKDNHTLRELYLTYNKISDIGAKDIAMTLKVNRTLTKLSLVHNQISDVGAKDIAIMLKDNDTLTVLKLTSNEITDAGAREIARALKYNHTMMILNIDNNEISDAGATDIAIALKDNYSLKELNLSSNQIGDAFAKEIARALKENLIMTGLYLSDNKISDAGGKELASALKDNHTLTELFLSRNNISDEVAKDIRNLISRNTAYREKQTEALKYRDTASALLKSPEIDEECLSSLNEALDMADQITEDLQNTGYNQAAALSRQVNTLRAIAHLRTGEIRAGLDLYVTKLQPQPAEAVSLVIADLILDEQPLPDENANRTLILMCLRGTTQYSTIQYNALQKLREIDKFTPSQPLATLLGVDKIVSVLDVSKPDEKMQEFETCIFYEDLVLSHMNPPVHKVFKGEIPSCVELSNEFELKKKGLLDSLKLAYPETPSEDHPASLIPPRY
jgi:Ran GTPase-activating protein (RanGAP) involved in mRNA processing and transport